MKLIVDENIPQGESAFGNFGEITLVSGRKINNEMLKDAEILIVRSITQVNENLLKNTKVKFVGTATIGTDHVDKEYLKSKNIRFEDAAGCNAYSVAEYVLTAITNYLNSNNKKFTDVSIGVVGYGNVGSKVVRFARALEMKVIVNDPPLERKGELNIFSSLDDALKCDIVTFHVPLNKTGVDKTVHLLNENNLSKIKSGALLINSSRGPVVDNTSLLKRLKEKSDLFTVLDVWESEPTPNPELLKIVNYSTPHIAGYSYEGKLNGTTIIYNKLCDFLGEHVKWNAKYPEIENDTFELDGSKLFEDEFRRIANTIYDLSADSNALKKYPAKEESLKGKYFDDLRKNYPIRREFNNYKIKILHQNEAVKQKLEDLRFRVF